MSVDFEEKTICDSVHGTIGVSQLELDVINTRTFQRLRKIKQLGFAHYVFPGAEHSRFSHSIGVMHLMSRMVDRLFKDNCTHVDDGKKKQTLRLAALLHDIGHYPISHLGEQAFQWYNSLDDNGDDGFGDDGKASPSKESVFHYSGNRHKNEDVKHERLGQVILENPNSDLNKIISSRNYDAAKIARIFNGEDSGNQFHVQLMSSTLDCDRLDYLVRDSQHCGVRYGLVDIDYIIQNIRWNEHKERVCFKSKAIHALEHFLTSRYHYYNIPYHKTVCAFETMAKALYFAMMKWPEFDPKPTHEIVSKLSEIKDRINSDSEFLANFTDEYFWYYLERWSPPNEILHSLKDDLLNRRPIRVVTEERILLSKKGEGERFNFVNKQIWNDSEIDNLLTDSGFTRNELTRVEKTIKFEAISSTIDYHERDEIDEDDDNELIKIIRDDGEGLDDLISLPQSIIHQLSKYEQHIVRLYAIGPKDKCESLRANLNSFISERVQ